MVQSQKSEKQLNFLRELMQPKHAALLIQEMQNGVVGPDSELPALAEAGAEIGLIEHVARVAAAARKASVPVIHCTADSLPGGFGSNRNARLFAAARRAGTESIPQSEFARPVPELGPEPSDLVLPRYHGLSPLSGTHLDQLLRNAGVTTLVVVGVSLNIAIPNLVFDAVNLSYQVVLVSDAAVAIPVEYGEEIIRNSLSLVATIATSDEIEMLWSAS
jgi:nicotinamidase-related amidase